MMNGPLAGIKVVECAFWQQGPVAGAVLGDLGADVVKIEPRLTGDPGRGASTILGVRVGLSGRNFYFENNNRNKRSITLDLTKDKGKEIIYRLIEDADVFITNWRLGVAERLGLGYETLSHRNPKLIYASSTGWGSKGPYADTPSFDYAGLARSGMMYMVGEPGPEPQALIVGFCDQIGAIITVQGILAALMARERHGVAQRVETSLLGSMIALEAFPLSAAAILGREFPRTGRSKQRNPLANYYRCLYDKWIMLGNVQPDRCWSDFCEAVNIRELEKDPRFENITVRAEHAEELISILDNIFLTRSREEWMQLFGERGIVCAPVQTASEVVADEQALANDYIINVDHPVWHRTKMIGFPWAFSETPASVRREAPEFGQHTEEILLEMGYTWDDIARLKNEEVV